TRRTRQLTSVLAQLLGIVLTVPAHLLQGQSSLTGSWRLVLRVERRLTIDTLTKRGRIDSTTSIAMTTFSLGELGLADSSVRAVADQNWQGIHPPTHIATEPLAFADAELNQCAGPTDFPTLVGRVVENSVRLAIRPYCDHGSIVLNGRIAGDS